MASLTEAGYAAVVAASPTHVRAVREAFLDHVSAADMRAMARVAAKLRVRPTDLA